MSRQHAEWIWFNGDWVPWREARVHVSAHGLHYGTSVYEGLRAYETPDGPAIFRLDAHLKRLATSCRLLRMPLAEGLVRELGERCVEIVALNRHRSCYIRPLVYRGSGSMSLNAGANPIETAVFTVEWPHLIGEEALTSGIDVAVSSWRRPAAGSALPMAKIGGQYVLHQLAHMEAQESGFGEAILLDALGQVSEGAGENVFVVVGGTLHTPPLASSILGGITRDTVLKLARELGIPVSIEALPRELLTTCDELFLTGTAAEITPVRSVDRQTVGRGVPGPVTRALQREFFHLVAGKTPDRFGWLTRVPQCETVLA